METNQKKEHPLDTFDLGAIKMAYTISKAFFIVAALGSIAGGIVMCATANGEAGLMVGGIFTMVLAPILIALLWLVVRVVFMLVMDVRYLRNENQEMSKCLEHLNKNLVELSNRLAETKGPNIGNPPANE